MDRNSSAVLDSFEQREDQRVETNLGFGKIDLLAFLPMPTQAGKGREPDLIIYKIEADSTSNADAQQIAAYYIEAKRFLHAASEKMQAGMDPQASRALGLIQTEALVFAPSPSWWATGTVTYTIAPSALPWFAQPLQELRARIVVSNDFLGEPLGREVAPAIKAMVEAVVNDCKTHSVYVEAVFLESEVDVEEESPEPLDVLHLCVKGSSREARDLVARLSREEGRIALALPPVLRKEFQKRFRIRVSRETPR